uniref:hypothetical protein n=1 Tax=Candidatus Igneacidithiobacillus taiwanensis TaxID=1945924 RepID=UPI00289F9838
EYDYLVIDYTKKYFVWNSRTTFIPNRSAYWPMAAYPFVRPFVPFCLVVLARGGTDSLILLG